jgi:hypothetical protein
MAFWASWIDSPHEVRTRTPDAKDLVFLTGTAVFDFKGTGSTWNHDWVYIPVGPAWRGVFSIAPTASLASVGNFNEAVNEGYAADNVNGFVYNDRILLVVALAVRDIDGHIYRVSYQATVLGYLA